MVVTYRKGKYLLYVYVLRRLRQCIYNYGCLGSCFAIRYLYGLFIFICQRDALKGLTQLRVLSLHGNNISMLADGVFRDLESISHV